MKLFLLLVLSSMAVAVNLPTATRAPHPYEFVRSGNTRRVNELGSKAPHQLNRLKPPASNKKASGVPPYAVLMEPLVKYSQPDPLYNESKEKVSEIKSGSDLKKSDLIKSKKEETKDGTGKQISSKTGHIIEDSEAEGTHHIQKQVQYGTYYEGPIYEEPEPIIEIIIKESNESLPTPPPITTTTQKRKKEPVQVFFVKYKKDPYAPYGEEKIVYDAPVPAITPPTNNADPHDYEEEEHHPHHEEFHGEVEDVTLPPRPSTTLKAIIKPDSEIVHGSSLHITFGKPKHGGDGHGGGYGGHGNGFGGGHGPENHHHYNSHHRGDHEESAPKPSIALPPKRKPAIAPRASSESQLTKRNPAPFHSQTQPPQQSFHNGPSFSTPREFHRPTPPPTFQQTPQFAAQPFKPQLPQIPQIPKIQPNHPVAPPTPSRPSPTHRYSTLPQHLQQHQKPQQSFPSFPPVRHNPPPQPTGATQQYYTINQPHLKASFHLGPRPTPPQQYHTISSQASQQNSFFKSQPHPPNPPPPVHHQHSKPVPQPLNALPQQPNSFSQVPNSFGPPQHTFPQSIPPQTIPGPLIQRTHQGPVLLPQNPFQNRGIFPPPQQHQPHQPPQLHQPPQQLQQQHQPLHQQSHHQLHQQSHQQVHQQIQQQQIPQQPLQHQQQHQQQVEQLNRLQQQQQRLQSQILQEQQNQFLYQQKFQTTYAPEIIKSVSPDISFTNHRFELKQPQLPSTTTPRPQFAQNVKSNVKYSTSQNFKTTTESFRKYPQTTTPQPVEYVTEDPKKAEEERRKKEERKKANVAALPKEVPDDLREQLLSSGILGNADIQILDYDKIGDIPIENLPPHALANFQAVAGSEPVPSIVRPDSRPVDAVAEASEQRSVVVPPNGSPSEVMEMKVVRYNPESKEGAQVPNQYVKEGATQLEPVVLNDSKYNRYLPLKVAGAQFPVPDVPELRGKNVTSVVVLAPVDYEFLQRHEDVVDAEEGRAGRRSSHPVLEVQGVHFVAGDVLKTLVKTPTSENYRKWLDKENRTSLDKQSVVLLVIESKNNGTAGEKEIFMYDIGTQKVSKLNGELSAQFVEVAESNSENDDLEEISDSNGGDFTVKDTAKVHTRTQRKAIASIAANIQKNKSLSSPR